jgi:hypothetical protein
LRHSDHFVTLQRWNAAALFQLDDGSIVREFVANDRIHKLAVSLDEKYMLAGCRDGSAYVWEIQTATLLCALPPPPGQNVYLNDIAFAGDGAYFALAYHDGPIFIFETQSGRTVRELKPPSGTGGAGSVALSPDGKQGAAVCAGGLSTFDVASGQFQKTAVTDAWSVKWSASEPYVALTGGGDGKSPFVRIVWLDGSGRKQDLEQPGRIGNVRPEEDGNFLITLLIDSHDAEGKWDYRTVGRRVDVAKGATHTLWEMKGGESTSAIDFDPKQLKGLYTSWVHKTELYDLRTGKVVLTVVNAKDFNRGYIRPGFFPFLLPVLFVVFFAGLLLIRAMVRASNAKIDAQKNPAGSQAHERDGSSWCQRIYNFAWLVSTSLFLVLLVMELRFWESEYITWWTPKGTFTVDVAFTKIGVRCEDRSSPYGLSWDQLDLWQAIEYRRYFEPKTIDVNLPGLEFVAGKYYRSTTEGWGVLISNVYLLILFGFLPLRSLWKAIRSD